MMSGANTTMIEFIGAEGLSFQHALDDLTAKVNEYADREVRVLSYQTDAVRTTFGTHEQVRFYVSAAIEHLVEPRKPKKAGVY